MYNLVDYSLSFNGSFDSVYYLGDEFRLFVEAEVQLTRWRVDSDLSTKTDRNQLDVNCIKTNNKNIKSPVANHLRLYGVFSLYDPLCKNRNGFDPVFFTV